MLFLLRWLPCFLYIPPNWMHAKILLQICNNVLLHNNSHKFYSEFVFTTYLNNHLSTNQPNSTCKLQDLPLAIMDVIIQTLHEPAQTPFNQKIRSPVHTHQLCFSYDQFYLQKESLVKSRYLFCVNHIGIHILGERHR